MKSKNPVSGALLVLSACLSSAGWLIGFRLRKTARKMQQEVPRCAFDCS